MAAGTVVNGIKDERAIRRCSQEALAKAARKLGAKQLTRDRLARIEIGELVATPAEAAAMAQALSEMLVPREGTRVRVLVSALGLPTDPLGATPGRRAR